MQSQYTKLSHFLICQKLGSGIRNKVHHLHWYHQIKYLDKNKYNTFPNKSMNPIKIYPHRWVKYFSIARFSITHTDLYIKCIFKHLNKYILSILPNSKISMEKRKYLNMIFKKREKPYLFQCLALKLQRCRKCR